MTGSVHRDAQHSTQTSERAVLQTSDYRVSLYIYISFEYSLLSSGVIHQGMSLTTERWSEADGVCARVCNHYNDCKACKL